MIIIATPTIRRRTNHVARHVTTESATLSPVEPVGVFLTDDLDQLEGEHDDDHGDHEHDDENEDGGQ